MLRSLLSQSHSFSRSSLWNSVPTVTIQWDGIFSVGLIAAETSVPVSLSKSEQVYMLNFFLFLLNRILAGRCRCYSGCAIELRCWYETVFRPGTMFIIMICLYCYSIRPDGLLHQHICVSSRRKRYKHRFL